MLFYSFCDSPHALTLFQGTNLIAVPDAFRKLKEHTNIINKDKLTTMISNTMHQVSYRTKTMWWTTLIVQSEDLRAKSLQQTKGIYHKTSIIFYFHWQELCHVIIFFTSKIQLPLLIANYYLSYKSMKKYVRHSQA